MRYSPWQLTGLGLFTALSLTWGASCTDDPATPISNNDPIRENPKTDPPANARLEHVGPSCEPTERVCTARLTFSSKRLLQAKLIGADGQPVRNTLIKFAIKQSDADQARLEAAQASTDSNGVAQTELSAGADAGSVRIVAETSDPNVAPVEFLISVNSKDASDYVVDFIEVGAARARDIKVHFYDKDFSCDDFYAAIAADRDNDPTTNPPNTFIADLTIPAQVEPDGRLPLVQRADVPNGTSYTVAAQAYSETNGLVEVSMGCKDNNPPVVSGSPTKVTVPLIKHLPYMVGDYRIIQRFDLREGLPPNVRLVVDLLGTAISDPGAFIVGCSANDMNCAIPTDGLVSVLVNFLPDGSFKQAITDFLDSSFTKAIVRNVINDVFNDFLRNNSRVPSWVKDSVVVTQDIYKTLSNFEVVGTLRVKAQPRYLLDVEGMPSRDAMNRTQASWIFADEASKNEHIWNEIAFFWTRDCGANAPPGCGKRTLNPGTLGNGSDTFVKGFWDGVVLDGSLLHINEHSLSLNYGALILTVVEKVVLPAIFGTNSMGQSVDSIERLFGMIINCDSVANTVANQVGGAVRTVVKNLCDQLLQQASDSIRDYATTTLVADGGESFSIESAPSKPCAMTPPDAYGSPWPGEPLPYVAGLGQKEPMSAQCEWDVKVRFSQNNTRSMNGSFYSPERR